ncbi:MAG: M15 family metallopeptidase [Pseudomonadota bacterium]|nr:M15 family metallopeptidase [Pseudomonadota bacterium]
MNEIDTFNKRVVALHHALGIAPDYIENSKLAFCREPRELVDTELDFYQRPQKLTPEAFHAWTMMKNVADASGIVLLLISAFRDIEYQYHLIARKVQEGRSIEEVLAVNAAPGYSEHHTGRALDIGTIGCDPLVEEFENTTAFQWLTSNAATFGFTMTYPRKNTYGIDYEPWHWCFTGVKPSL